MHESPITLQTSHELHDSEVSSTIAHCKNQLQTAGYWPFTTTPKIIHIASNTEITLGDELIIIVEPEVHITIHEQEHTKTVIIIQENAHVRYITTSNKNVQRVAYLKQGAHIVWIDAATRAATTKNTTILAGEGANARFSSIFIGIGDEQYNAEATMIHAASRTSSNMLTRAALLDNSTGIYRGLVKILPDSAHCDAYQREDTLLLGNNARMDAAPILEISNDNVKCSHGVAIGQINDEQLFYLESRGITKTEAKHMIIEGFFDPLLISMGEQGVVLREQIRKHLEVEQVDEKKTDEKGALHV